MSKQILLPSILALILSVNSTMMNGQEYTKLTNALTSQQQSIVTISALTATGDLEQLKTQLNSGLDAGLTVNEIKEVLVQLYAYCGFPRSLNGISAFMKVLEDRKAKGISDITGKAATVSKDSTDKYEKGRKVLEMLTNSPQSKPAPGFGEFAPLIDAFLKEHLFADIFESDVLSYKQREIVTISALSAMTGLESQLQSHLAMGRNTGLTDNQFVQIAGLVEKHIGKSQANILRKLLSKPEVPILQKDMMVRISEIEIIPQYLEEYKAILKEEAAASVQKEPGVIAIFPMYQKENPTQIRIIEMYADAAAYQSHLKTPHFQHYKTSTLQMVKSLRLIDMGSIDPETIQKLFKKIK